MNSAFRELMKLDFARRRTSLPTTIQQEPKPDKTALSTSFNELKQLEVEVGEEKMEGDGEDGELQEKLSPLDKEPSMEDCQQGKEAPRFRNSLLPPKEIAQRVHDLYSEVLEGGELSTEEMRHLLLEAIDLDHQLGEVQEKRSHLIGKMEQMIKEEEEKIRELQGGVETDSKDCMGQNEGFTPYLPSTFFSKSTSMLAEEETNSFSPYSNTTAATLPDFYLADPIEWTKSGKTSADSVSEASPLAGKSSLDHCPGRRSSLSFFPGETSTNQADIPCPSVPELSGRINSMLGRIVREFPIAKSQNDPGNKEEGLEAEEADREAIVSTPQDLLSLLITRPSNLN